MMTAVASLIESEAMSPASNVAGSANVIGSGGRWRRNSSVDYKVADMHRRGIF
jgi:hypothetical protein